MKKNISVEKLKTQLEKNKNLLLEYRNKRIRPLTDDKILLGWNALLCTALCKAYAALGIEKYKTLAITNMQFLEEKLCGSDNIWKHTYKNNSAKISAFFR